MARTVVITDDITGEQGAEPVEFSWGGRNLSIDLTEDSRKKFEAAIQPYLDKAQPRMAPTDQERREVAKPKPRQRTRSIDYSSPEHAGSLHRGRVTEAEAAYVREHFDEVNARLSSEGSRTLDRSDPKTKERYGLK
jgi:Lsr2